VWLSLGVILFFAGVGAMSDPTHCNGCDANAPRHLVNLRRRVVFLRSGKVWRRRTRIRHLGVANLGLLFSPILFAEVPLRVAVAHLSPCCLCVCVHLGSGEVRCPAPFLCSLLVSNAQEKNKRAAMYITHFIYGMGIYRFKPLNA
jgi:hypothetical protein